MHFFKSTGKIRIFKKSPWKSVFINEIKLIIIAYVRINRQLGSNLTGEVLIKLILYLSDDYEFRDGYRPWRRK